jgi:SNF2 family DNA or RNA helicase
VKEAPSLPLLSADLRINDSEVEIRPASYLGEDLFTLYRATVERTSRYDRAQGCQVCALGRYPEARADLEASGFRIREEKRLQGHLQGETDRRARAAEAFPKVLAAMDKIRPLYPYQKDGAKFLHSRQRALLADEQGVGKTIQTLAALPPDASAIVVCPAIARNVWVQECNQFRPDLFARRLETKTFPSPKEGEVIVASYEDVLRRLLPTHLCPYGVFTRMAQPFPQGDDPSNCEATLQPTCCQPKDAAVSAPCGEERPGIMSRRFSRCDRPARAQVPSCSHLVTDEAHYLKNKKSQRAKAHALVEGRAAVGWHLTGTPLPNTPDELWNVLDSVGLAREAFGSRECFIEVFGGTFEEIYVRGEKKKKKIVVWPDARTLEASLYGAMRDDIRALLGKVMLRRTKAEVLPDLPPKRYQWITVDVEASLDRECEQASDTFERNHGMRLTEVNDENQIPLHEIAPLREKLAIAKVPAAMDLAEQYEAACQPLIVFSAHLEPTAALAARKGWAKIDGSVTEKRRQKICADFQAGKLKGLAATIKAAGTALTLHKAHDLLFIDLDWVPANNAQAADRVHRIGQIYAVLITILTSRHPMDAHVTDVLARKSKMISAAIG